MTNKPQKDALGVIAKGSTTPKYNYFGNLLIR